MNVAYIAHITNIKKVPMRLKRKDKGQYKRNMYEITLMPDTWNMIAIHKS